MSAIHVGPSPLLRMFCRPFLWPGRGVLVAPASGAPNAHRLILSRYQWNPCKSLFLNRDVPKTRQVSQRWKGIHCVISLEYLTSRAIRL